MTERRDYVGLDWVAGEIAESLQAAETALQAYLDDPNDSTRLHFCLAHIHQVQGSLQMVEFFGIALLADEMEQLVNAVLDRAIPDSLLSDALLALKRALGDMPRYLEKVRDAHREFPAELILALNELRAVRGQTLMATSGIFSPDLIGGTQPKEEPLQLGEAEFLDVAKKLRQMYQVALLGYYRGHEQRKNLNYMAKVCARAAKICRGYPVQELWVVCIALLEGLLNNSIYSGFAVRSLLRRIDREIRLFVEAGPAVLARPLPEALLRDMLFYVANSKATSNYIRDVKKRYNTSASLPALDSGDNPEALAGVRESLARQLNQLATRLADGEFNTDSHHQFEQLTQSAAVLGLTQDYQTLKSLQQRLPEDPGADSGLAAELNQVADALRELPPQTEPSGLFNDSEEAQQQLDRAHLAVVRESRNGLELAKEAVVNFVANQWHTDYLKELPDLIGSISGSLRVAQLGRAAHVLDACRQFVCEQLLDDPHTPDWQTLDALADALTSVDYYLERCASDFSHSDPEVLSLAERCVSLLGYPVPGAEPAEARVAEDSELAVVELGTAEPAEPELPIEPAAAFAEEAEPDSGAPGPETIVAAQALESIPEAPVPEVEEAEDLPAVDDELVEIFVEEAEEVLDTLREFRPVLDDTPKDEEARTELRRGFHTLKGSGRMVQATRIGELAWSVENMLNRVVEGRFELDAARLNVIDQVMAVLPSMIEAFKRGKAGEPEPAGQLAAQAEALAAEQSPDLSAFTVGDEPESAAPAEPDDTLADIFVSEARIHLQMLENFLAHAEAPIDVPDSVQRSLHTLKGAANMAEMQNMASLISPLEGYIKEMRALRHPADVDALMLLRDASGAAAAAIDRIELGEPEQVSNLEVLKQRVDSLHRRLLLNAQDSESNAAEQQLAPGELDSFLVSTGETLAAVEHTLANYADAASLHRLADTCGQIARRAESIASLGAIAELADALAEVMREARNPVPEEAVQLCQDGTEALDGMLNQLAAEQKPAEDAELLERLRGFDYGTALPASTEQLEADDAEDGSVEVEAPLIAMPDAREPELPDDDIPLVEDAIDIGLPEEPAPVAIEDTESEEITLSSPPLEEDDVDPEVAAIFLEEADELLEGVDEAINAWSESDGSQSDLNNLLRHLHTIKGGARMAGLSSLGSYTHEFESFVESAIASGDSQSDQFLPRLHAFQDSLVSGLARVRRGEAFNAVVPSAEPVRRKEMAPASSDNLQPSRVDAEVASIFLEEAEDLIEAIDDAIQYWTGDRGNTEHLELLQRHLHTFKGGARRAGMAGLGDISHEFESYVAQTTARDDGFLAQLLSYQDRINEGLDAVRKGNRNWVSEPLLPSLPTEDDNPGELIEADEVMPFRSGDRAPATMESQMPQEMIKVSAQLMENLVNLAGETSISRGRAEEQVAELAGSLDEMAMTVERLQEQVRRLDIETEAQILFRQEQVESEGQDGFDPLEFDRYSQLQQLSRSLMESSSDLLDIRNTLGERTRDMETLLLQQGRINTELQEGLMRSRMVHFTRMIPRLRRIVRQVSLEVSKRVEFKVFNAEGELDRQVLERIIPPLEHMLRNAVDHGIETTEARRAAGKSPVGNIHMRFGREGGDVLIELRDDGGGINFEAVRAKAVKMGLIGEHDSVTEEQLSDFLFEAGFSTASEVTQISGRGVGMDVVYSEIKQLGGSIAVDSKRGQGTRFTIRLPFTVSVNRALMVSIGGDIFAIPINTVEGVVRVSPYELEVYYQEDAPPFEYANQNYMLRYLGGLLRTQAVPHLEGQTEPRPVLLARGTDRPIAVQVDSILGSREIVVKALGPQFSHVHGLSGATVLGDGSVVVIVDIPALVRAEVQRGRDGLLENKPQQVEQSNPLVMVVDDSVTVRKVTSRLLERQGFDVLLAKDGVDAVTQLQTIEELPDVILLDIEMPRMDGFEVASRVRHTSRLQDIPIIMITSRTGEKHRERAHHLGVNKYLGKPYQEITLLQVISEVMGETAAP